jgi:hypothetical protein
VEFEHLLISAAARNKFCLSVVDHFIGTYLLTTSFRESLLNGMPKSESR